MSGWLKKVKALDPHLQYPEVGPGEAGCRNHLKNDTATMVAKQESRGPEP